jgi:hypothetical protein
MPTICIDGKPAGAVTGDCRKGAGRGGCSRERAITGAKWQ